MTTIGGRPDANWSSLVALRRDLHRHPELAHQEGVTAQLLVDVLKRHGADQVVTDIAGHGLAAVFHGVSSGSTLLVRCELDGLPIAERSGVEWASRNAGRAHACGHDGHMAMVTGLAMELERRRPERGSVVLLYQPAEEVGEGARRVLDDPAFESLRPDRVFALHNLPGFELGEVVLRAGPLASASRGLVATLDGKTSHAGEPELGQSPALALARAIAGLATLSAEERAIEPSALITVVGARLGSRAFGTSPGHAELYATLRAHGDATVDRLWERSSELVRGLAAADELDVDLQQTEDFPATVNDAACVALVERAATDLGAPIRQLDRPFPWSEDFGHFTREFPGCLFGLGSGADQPALHNPDYDFPDELIKVGTTLLARVVQSALTADC